MSALDSRSAVTWPSPPDARRAFRPRRAIPAIVTAGLLATAAVLTAAEVIAALFHRSANVLPVASLARLGRDTHWDDLLSLGVAGATAAVGLVLIVLALWPGRPRAIALGCDSPGVVIGITPLGLRRHITQAAEGVDGIARARVNAGGRRIRVHATSPLRDARGLTEQVRQAVRERVDDLAPLRTPRIRVTVRHRED